MNKGTDAHPNQEEQVRAIPGAAYDRKLDGTVDVIINQHELELYLEQAETAARIDELEWARGFFSHELRNSANAKEAFEAHLGELKGVSNEQL
jgi:hypothetical protein